MQPGIVAALTAVVRQHRAERGISVVDLGHYLEEAKLSGSASKISRFENGKQHQTLDKTFSVYADRFGLSLLDLLDDAEEQLEAHGVTRKRKSSPAMEKARSALRAARVEDVLVDAPSGQQKAAPQKSGTQAPRQKKRQGR